MFPLIQLPRKSEAVYAWVGPLPITQKFPLIQLPRKSEVEDLFQLSKKLERRKFPLIQLPRKSEAAIRGNTNKGHPSFH